VPTASEKPSSESDDRSSLAKAWDVARYAPIGLLVEGPFLLPKLAQLGKAHVRNAQAVGRLALRQGRADIKRRLDETESELVEMLRLLGLLPPPQTTVEGRDAPSSRDTEPSPDGIDRGGADGGVARHRVAGNSAAGPPQTVTRPSPPDVSDLAIADYDSLSAPQVVNRLSGLRRDELEAVRRYELAHRGRKTILNKVAQLQT
jgi:hypothetical protein